MLNFTPVQEGEIAFADLTARLTPQDLATLTNEMIDEMLALIAGCVDEDVTFVPVDPDAHDSFSAENADVNLAWTLGHVIVHTTASSEESAALAAEMARGVPNHGRSRSEEPWENVTTIAHCRRRLEESRRMRLASLGMWPDSPDLENRHAAYEFVGENNAIGYFVLGLFHDDSHLGQIAEIVRQAKAARGA